jgi:histidyl-tRNA synthetase
MNKKKNNNKIGKVRKSEGVFTLRGFPDLLPKDSPLWKDIWKAGNSIAELHGFHCANTPAVESAAFFEKVFGKDKKFSEKHWYTFMAGARERLVLRPSGLFGIIRSYVNHHLGYFASPLKTFFFGSSFVKEPWYFHETQGESREWGFSVLGDNDPVYDIEIIGVVISFLKLLKIRKVVLKINTNGCRTCRGAYREKIKSFYSKEKNGLCKQCAGTGDYFSFLKCAEEKCAGVRQSAPLVLDYLCQNCNNHFKTLLELLEEEGILYELDPHLIREGDMWNRLVFSVYAPTGQLLAIGGRFDYLFEAVGGRQVPAAGSVIFLDRVVDVMKGLSCERKEKPKIFFIAIGDHAKKASVRLIGLLRDAGIVSIEALGKKSLKMQMKTAERMKVPLTLLLGQKEAFDGTVIVRDMRTSAQETVVADHMVEVVKKKLKEE